MKNKIIDCMLTCTFIALILAIFMRMGFNAGMAKAIENITVKQQGDFIICEVYGSEWKTILELED